MADASSPKQMITEDEDLRSAFLALMRRHVTGWPTVGAGNAPVYVRRAEGADNALAQVATVWKTEGLDCLGVVVDADDKLLSRWARIRKFATDANFNSVPDNLPPSGLILVNEDGRQFGAWVMPDNRSSGMLETFCIPLIPPKHQKLWSYASDVARKAKDNGATYIDQHSEKAHIHTFLAWNDPPGRSIGRALTEGCLDCCANGALAFVNWSKELFKL